MENQKKSQFEGLKTEFKKIIWPTKDDTTKQTIAVVITSVVIGCLVAVIDFIIRIGVENLVNFPGK